MSFALLQCGGGADDGGADDDDDDTGYKAHDADDDYDNKMIPVSLH